MKKRLPIIIVIIVILYTVIFAVTLLITMYLPSSIYENPNLITRSFNSANKINFRKNTQDGITTINCGKMTGMDTIWKYKAVEDMTLQMYYIFEVTSGKAKLVLITPDDAIITLAEQDSAEYKDEQEKDSSTVTSTIEPMTELNLEKGENRIKIVCERGTSFSLSFKISE
ncbi:MAG: hypothetical protein K2N44_02715 [Lachnospiraceae bacterium]|nr:hypothetical protein [Lachnospiraceae bacterium]